MPAVAPVLLGWAEQYAREGRGRGAVFGECVARGVAPAEAKEMALDAVQEALAKVLEKYGERPEHYVGGYRHFCYSTTRVAVNRVRSRLRGRRLQELAFDVEAEESDPRVEAVRQCLEMLPERQRELLSVRWDEDQTYGAMAATFVEEDGISEMAAYLRVRRECRAAEAALREMCERHYPDLEWGDTTDEVDQR